MPFRFVHTADIHLDSPLRSLALRDPEIAELIGDATRAAFVNVVDLCLEEGVDALLIAGDLYDGDQTSMKTARFLAAQLRRLDAAGIATFVIRGNHDALSRITRELVLPPSVSVFDGRGGVREIEAGALAVAIHGISFSQPQAPESLVARFKAPVPGAVNIGMLHTSLAGAPGHDVYAPCSIADLEATGFDYWALGHIHARGEWRGRATIVMPGMPQGRDIGESGRKSVSLVTIGDDRSVHVEERETAVARFERVPVAGGGDGSWKALVAALGGAIVEARAACPTRHLVLRPLVSVPPALAARALRDHDLLLEEARLAAEGLAGVFIDKVEIDTAADVRARPDGGALGDLAALMEAEILSSPGFQAQAEALVAQLAKAMPRDLRDMRDVLRPDASASEEAARAALTAEGAAFVLARLAASEREEG